MPISELTKEYLEKYAGDEYVYKNITTTKGYYTIVYKLLEKSVCTNSPLYLCNSNQYRYTNCEVVDIINDKCCTRIKEFTTLEYFINFNGGGAYSTRSIGDVVDSDQFVLAFRDFEEYVRVNQ